MMGMDAIRIALFALLAFAGPQQQPPQPADETKNLAEAQKRSVRRWLARSRPPYAVSRAANHRFILRSGAR
jgi:hypothetical protein